MKKFAWTIYIVLAFMLAFSPLPVQSEKQEGTQGEKYAWIGMGGEGQARSEMRDEEIYGHQLMTPQERDEYRTRMRAAESAEEREQIRKEHHKQMVERAKERGVTLPDEPRERGMGRGMGPGGGMGGGR